MNLELLSALGQIVGAAGVIVSLLYLSRQIAHSTRVSRVEGYERLSSKVTEFAMAITASADLAALISRVQIGGEGRESFDPTERIRIGYIYFALFQITASVFERYKSGLISQPDLDRWMSQNAGLWAAPYLPQVWPILRPNFSEEFAAFAESRYPLIPPPKNPAEVEGAIASAAPRDVEVTPV